MWKQLLRFLKILRNRQLVIDLGMYCAVNTLTMEKYMINRSTERQPDPVNLEEDFNLAFKLVFFDENDEELQPAQYKPLSTFSVERDIPRQ